MSTYPPGRCRVLHLSQSGEAQQLILKRALASRPSGESSGDDYDVLADGAA
jgi:hypothetical protein